MSTLLRLADMQRVRRWMVANRREHPAEYQAWDAVTTLWVMGATGWLPTLILDQGWWALPLCLLGWRAPTLYVRWRVRAHAARRLRCDWLPALPAAVR
ncbi:hypothetical protein [Ottowia sp.]|uniref:hypothetical protein n=1 Tax=Ottowia sp. TaxID=1898956 RepID=UPI0039E218C9